MCKAPPKPATSSLSSTRAPPTATPACRPRTTNESSPGRTCSCSRKRMACRALAKRTVQPCACGGLLLRPDAMRGTLRQVLGLLVMLAGIGVAMPAHSDSRLCIVNDVITFGNRFVGTATSANVAVTNCGDQTLSFTDVSVHPATGPAFHVSTTCAPGLALPPGASCTASVQFAPL